MKHNKQTVRNSSFTFEEFGQVQLQNLNVYSYPSDQIKASMQDMVGYEATQSKFYNNHIFHSTHKYEVPVYKNPKRSQKVQSYNHFYSTFRKFTKPYGQNTKYSDSISRNSSLVRRGPCDISIPLDMPKKSSQNYLKTKRALRYSKTQQKTVEKVGEPIRNKKNEEEQNNLFEKTVDSQYLIFKRLYAKERSGRDRVGLNNSMNRLLAAEMIHDHIKPKKYFRTLTEQQ